MSKSHKPEQWGNLTLPDSDLSPEDLLRSDINKVIANRLKAKDPNWLAKVHEAASDPTYLEEQSQRSLKKWSDPEFHSKMKATHLAIWENNDQRRQSVSQWASSLERTEEHCANISKAGKKWHADPENAKLHQQRMKAVGHKISAALGGKPKTKKTLCCWCSAPMPNHIHQRHENSCKQNPNKQGSKK